MLKPTKLAKRENRIRAPLNPFLKETVRSFKGSLFAVFFFSFFVNLLTLSVPLYMLQIYAKVLPSRSIDTLLFLTAIALIAVIALGALEAIRRSIMAKMGIRFDAQLSDHLLNSSINRTIHKGRSSVNVMRELSSIRSFLSGSSIFPLLDMPWTPLFLIIMYLLHPLLGLVGLVGSVIMVALACFNEYATREPSRAAHEESGMLLEDARAYVRNADVIQAMGMHSTILSDWRNRNARSLVAHYQAGRLNTRLHSLSRMVRLFLQVGVICTAAWLILQHQLSTGVTIVSVLLLRRAISPLEESIQSWKSVLKARTSFQTISEYLDHSSSLEHSSDMPRPEGILEAAKISFRRSGEKRAVVSSVRMKVMPGMVCALTGPTAAGKSTLLRVMAGVLPPNSGKVTLGGYELSQWSPEQLGPAVGYLPQDVCLFPGSVSDNISRLKDASIDDVIEAARLANAHELIQTLPQGYDTVVEEDGVNLSGGQKQRIGLARAVFGNPAVVLLDEPDASLDSSGRSALRKTLRELRKRRFAVLMITHRSSTEQLADRVYKLEDGHVSLLRDSLEEHSLDLLPELDVRPEHITVAANDSDSKKLDTAIPLVRHAIVGRTEWRAPAVRPERRATLPNAIAAKSSHPHAEGHLSLQTSVDERTAAKSEVDGASIDGGHVDGHDAGSTVSAHCQANQERIQRKRSRMRTSSLSRQTGQNDDR